MVTGQIVLLIYGLLILAGGWFGQRAGSHASLVAGTTSGTGLLLALLISRFHMATGLGLGAGIALVLCIVFGLRLAKTKKVMPSGMLLVLSLAALALLSAAVAGSV